MWKIPLKKFSKIGNCKQYVFGRIGVIFPYYNDTTNFITLLLKDDIYYGQNIRNKNMNVNDLYVYCASVGQESCKLLNDIDLTNYFPIRIVLHNEDSILFKYNFVKKLHTLVNREAKLYESILQWNPNWRQSSILAREICQLINLFDIYIKVIHIKIYFLLKIL